MTRKDENFRKLAFSLKGILLKYATSVTLTSADLNNNKDVSGLEYSDF
jgi:hypothetical protein